MRAMEGITAGHNLDIPEKVIPPMIKQVEEFHRKGFRLTSCCQLCMHHN